MTAAAQFALVLLLTAAAVILPAVARRLYLREAAALIMGGLALALIPGMRSQTG